MSAKMAIDAVSEASGDDWRALRDRLLKAEELVQALKDILPQHGDELDSMLVGLRSKVDKLGASRKKKNWFLLSLTPRSWPLVVTS